MFAYIRRKRARGMYDGRTRNYAFISAALENALIGNRRLSRREKRGVTKFGATIATSPSIPKRQARSFKASLQI